MSVKLPKHKVCFVNLHLAIFATKGSGVLEKRVNKAQASKTVFGHLTWGLTQGYTARQQLERKVLSEH